MADPGSKSGAGRAKGERREVWLERERVRERFDADARRIERQRTRFVMLPPGHAKDALLKAMLERAGALLVGGRADEADAILEFVPSADVERLLDEVLPAERSEA